MPKEPDYSIYRDLMAGPGTAGGRDYVAAPPQCDAVPVPLLFNRPPDDVRWEAAPLVGLPVRLKVKVLPHGVGLPLPSYGSDGAVGLDLRAACDAGAISPGGQHVIPTGLAFAVPPGHAGLVLSRSGLAAKSQVAITNAPGLVDPDYRGEVFLILENRGIYPFQYVRGDRLGQFLLVPAPAVELVEVEELDDTTRGTGGLGSTGVSS